MKILKTIQKEYQKLNHLLINMNEKNEFSI